MTSTAPYGPDPARANKNLSAILQGLANAGQETVAAALETDGPTISRMKSPQGKAKYSDLEQLAKLLAACKLKVVPTGMRCFDPDAIGAILTLAKMNLARIAGPHELAFEDPE